MDKVKVSHKVAKALDTLLENYSKDRVMSLLGNRGTHSMRRFDAEAIDFLRTATTPLGLAEMLLNGYEVELTPQDKIKELFEKNLDMYDQAKEDGLDGDAMFRDGRSDGILRTLEILNIKVPGVNE